MVKSPPGRVIWSAVRLAAGPGLAWVVWWTLPPTYLDHTGAVRELSGEARATLGVTTWMAVWWLTEATHISTTALLPLLLFPLVGSRTLSQAATPYAHPLVFLFLGGFLLALAMQRWKLDRRIALLTLAAVGTRPAAMVAGFMAATAMLSAFVSNTATTAMMLPIALSVLELVRTHEDPDESRKFGAALLLAIAYSATLGGMATLIGTPPNVALAAFLGDAIDPPYRLELTFDRWLLIGLPVSLVMLPLTWFLLTRVLYRLGSRAIAGGRALIRRELVALGPFSWAEASTFVIFMMTAAGWILRPWIMTWELPEAWGGGRPLAHASDTAVAIAAGIVLFLWPSGRGPRQPLLDWPTARKLPWEILLLFGGGLSLASAMRATGVAEFLGAQAASLQHVPHWVVILAVTALVVFLTELTSNLATVAALLPVLTAIAPGLGIHPYRLLFPATVAASCAFMLPVATPPNAIVFGSGMLRMTDLMRAGWWLNLISIAWLTLLATTWFPFVLSKS